MWFTSIIRTEKSLTENIVIQYVQSLNIQKKTTEKIGKANKERWREKREEKINDHTSNKD